MKKFIKKVFSALFLLSFSVLAFAEEKEQLLVRVDQVISSDYPEMTAYAVVKNQKDEIVSGLAPGLFSFRVDSQVVKVKSKITPFSMTDEKVDYTIMVSNNGLMEGEPFYFQKDAIIKFVDLMNDDDTLSIYTIGEDAGVVCEDITRKAFNPAVVNGIELSDAQPKLYDSVINLVRKVSQKNIRRKVIIILSDGRDQNSRYTKDQLSETLSTCGIPVYSVGIKILSNQTLSTLDEISQLTGGSYYYAARMKDITDSLKHIIDCIKQSYVIKMKVKGISPDNQVHILELKVSERDSEGRGLKTFVAVRHPVPKWLKILLLIIGLLAVIAALILILFTRIQKRKSMGITKRRCPDCGNIMKDSWESCPFCKYMPELKKKGSNKKADLAELGKK